MSWKKHFTVYKTNNQNGQSSVLGNNSESYGNSSVSRFQSWLPEVYTGMPNRVERYMQYDQMDMDVEINMALDTIAEFSTQIDEETASPFKIVFKEDPTDSEAKVAHQALKQWCNINDWDRRMFRTFRNVVKFGDQPFVRDPNTWELMFVNPQDVIGVVVNESEGKEPEQYIVRNLDLNVRAKLATAPMALDRTTGGIQGGQYHSAGNRNSKGTIYGAGIANNKNEEVTIAARDFVHLSLSEGMDTNWPFGASILDPVFKTYKQKELLEDAIIIYRVQRAPERRVFYIDTGDMPMHKAAAFLERVKMEVHQKRIPNKTGGGGNIIDAQYDPLGMLEDYFFAQNESGRGSKVEVLPGGDQTGEITDLSYFADKLLRGLRVPSSYMPINRDDQGGIYNDGRVGTAYIQEYRFNMYCQRLQNIISPVFDREFKLFMKNKGIQIDSSIFDIKFTDPQSFSDYRQIELDGARAGLFNQMDGTGYLSKRFILKKYLGLSDAEILENERMYLEENPKKGKGQSDPGEADMGLGDVGIKSGDLEFDDEDFEMDDMPGDDFDMGGESPLGGGEAGPDIGGTEGPTQ